MEELRFCVPGMTCGHCVAAVRSEIEKVGEVVDIAIDLDTKAVVVRGAGLDREALWAAVNDAGYEAVA